MIPSSRTLLLTLDAFNTLFYPRPPVAVQYTQTAQSLGFLPASTSPNTVQSAFRTAFKHHAALRPNYGRQIPGFGGPKAWWAGVIRECFALAKGNGAREQDVPEVLVQRLLARFQGDEAYTLYPDVLGFFHRLAQWKGGQRRSGGVWGREPGREFDNVVLGILSNTDDRVAPILTSLGLSVGTSWADDGTPLTPAGTKVEGDSRYDVDFVVTSYEAGSEKPHKGIFEAAEKRAMEHLLTVTSSRDGHSSISDKASWNYVHVGDDYEQDYEGAINAGWDCYLLPRNGIGHAPKDLGSSSDIKQVDSLPELLQKIGLNGNGA